MMIVFPFGGPYASCTPNQKLSRGDAFLRETLHAEFSPAENLVGGSATPPRGVVQRSEGVADVGEARGGARPSPQRGASLGDTGEASGDGSLGVGALDRVHGHSMGRSRVDRSDAAPSAGVDGILRGASGPFVDCL